MKRASFESPPLKKPKVQKTKPKVEKTKTEHHQLSSTFQRLEIANAEVWAIQAFISAEEACSCYDDLQKLDVWERRGLKLFGRDVQEARETASFSSPGGLNMRYSGRNNFGIAYPEALHQIEIRLKEFAGENADFRRLFGSEGVTFNFCFANFYREGSQYLGWHSDDEKNLKGPIVCVSLGATRAFEFLSRDGQSTTKHKHVLRVAAGDMLVMTGDTQKNYKHRIPAEKKIEEGRISLTFRNVIVEEQRTKKARTEM